MCRYVVVTLILVVGPWLVRAPPPLRVTIDCGARDRNSLRGIWQTKSEERDDELFNVDSFCNYIHSAIPKAIQNGKVVFVEPDTDQDGFGNTHVPISLPPPEGYVPKLELPKFRVPKLKIPKLKVPKLGMAHKQYSPPKVGSPMALTFRDLEEDSSAERMEKFKKGVKKMLHVVKVLGQLDQYLSERTRIIVDKLSKTFID